jgi:hypothetical protein
LLVPTTVKPPVSTPPRYLVPRLSHVFKGSIFFSLPPGVTGLLQLHCKAYGTIWWLVWDGMLAAIRDLEEGVYSSGSSGSPPPCCSSLDTWTLYC